MSESSVDRQTPTEDDNEELTREDLLAQVEALQAENERLRAVYREAHHQRYRRTAGGFAVIGILALVGAAVLPGVRTILLALGGTGLFAAVMTLYLTPESFVPASIGEAISRTYSENIARLVADLGLSETRLYVSTSDGPRLYLPQFAAYDLPTPEALATPFVTTANDRERGLALTPIGDHLFEEFERAHSGPVPDRPAPLARALTDAAIEQFELLDTASPDVDAGRVAIGCGGARITPLSALDHPVTSLVAVGLTTQLDTPVDITTRTPDDERYDTLLLLTWDQTEVAPAGESDSAPL